MADRDDRHHGACRALLEGTHEPLLVPSLVVGEVSYLVETRLGARAQVRFLEAIAAGQLIVEPGHPQDWVRIAELVWQYRDLPLGSVDASVVAAAERLGETSIATLDRRDFSIVRPRHCEAFQLLPA